MPTKTKRFLERVLARFSLLTAAQHDELLEQERERLHAKANAQIEAAYLRGHRDGNWAGYEQGYAKGLAAGRTTEQIEARERIRRG